MAQCVLYRGAGEQGQAAHPRGSGRRVVAKAGAAGLSSGMEPEGPWRRGTLSFGGLGSRLRGTARAVRAAPVSVNGSGGRNQTLAERKREGEGCGDRVCAPL